MHIEDYGFLSDTETGALVGKNGSIDWLCMPRFDSGACFSRLLGDKENGYWQIAPKAPVVRVNRRYRGDTLILETEFETEEGCVRLVDLMPLRDGNPDVVRIVEGVRGCVEMAMELVIRFDYGRIIPWVRSEDGGIIAIAGPDALILRTDVETHGRNLSTVADFSVSAGESKAFILTWFPSHHSSPQAANSAESLKQTESFWNEWASRANPVAEWRDASIRSLLVLKGLTYAPTGGIVAAATTSLPEAIGGSRNWDYRFCWLRDATFTLFSLLDAGYTEEAAAWRDWLLRSIAGDAAQMQVLYGCGGERTLLEYELPHLSGYENSSPVRIGNAASQQFQLDVYGEVLDAMHQARRAGIESNEDAWDLEKHLIDYVSKHWRDSDQGIWEMRGDPQPFTHSKMMAWVALDRAVQACEKFNRSGDLRSWRRLRDEIHQEVCERGFNADRGAFTQAFGSDHLDASLLLMPLVGFLPATDPRVRSTIQTIKKELCQDGLVLRYRPESGMDGLSGGEGTFLPCSFWLVDGLKMIGEEAEARERFQHLLTLRNDLGLIAEEYDPHLRRQVGNFPQAFTHVALVNSASNLGKSSGPANDRGEGSSSPAKT